MHSVLFSTSFLAGLSLVRGAALGLHPRQDTCTAVAGDTEGLADTLPDPAIFSEISQGLLLSTSIDNPLPKSRVKRQVTENPEAAEAEAEGQGTIRFRASDYVAGCLAQGNVYMAGKNPVGSTRLGDTVLVLPTPAEAPDITINTDGSRGKSWVCDHILELNTLDDFFLQPSIPVDNYRFISDQVSGINPAFSCRLDRINRVLNSALGNLHGVDRRANALKNVLLQGRTPDWTRWEDHVVALTYLYLIDPSIQTKYRDTADRVGEVLDNYKQTGVDGRDIRLEFKTFAVTRLRLALQSLALEWEARTDDSVDNRFSTNTLVNPRAAARRDGTYRPVGGSADIPLSDWVVDVEVP